MARESEQRCEESATRPSDIRLSHLPPVLFDIQPQVRVRRMTSERSRLDAAHERQWSAKGRGVRRAENGVMGRVHMSVRALVARKEREKGNILTAERKVLTRLACEKGRGVGGVRMKGEPWRRG
ncbi:hypothetical protein BT69DRAFT_75489 [Atractiella rhizophila]|nr:hypothetical protein BT69DRAFT_75489 [Atractiella rhizophila]